MSRLLVDTHALLWWLADDPALSQPTRDALADPANDPLGSAASIWEIAIKRGLGKLSAPDALLDVLDEQSFGRLPIDARHAWQVGELPAHHGDPFDRLLIAQAVVERLPILTADARFADYPVDVRW